MRSQPGFFSGLLWFVGYKATTTVHAFVTLTAHTTAKNRQQRTVKPLRVLQMPQLEITESSTDEKDDGLVVSTVTVDNMLDDPAAIEEQTRALVVGKTRPSCRNLFGRDIWIVPKSY